MRSWWPIPALVAAALVFAVADRESGLHTWWQLRQDLQGASQRIAALEADVAAYQENSASLESDAFAIERAIRERLEYARPGETVVRLGAKPLPWAPAGP